MKQTDKKLKERVEELERKFKELEDQPYLSHWRHDFSADNESIRSEDMAGCSPLKEEFEDNDWVYYKPWQSLRQFKDIEYCVFKACTNNYRHATNKEIEQYLIKQAKERGFDVGKKVKFALSYPHCEHVEMISKFILITDDRMGSYDTDKYFRKNGIHLAIKCKFGQGSWLHIPLNECEIVKEELTFGGENIIIEKPEKGDILIKCAGYKTTLGMIKKSLEVLESPIIETLYINHYRRDHHYPIDSLIEIGCVEGTIGELENIIKKAEEL